MLPLENVIRVFSTELSTVTVENSGGLVRGFFWLVVD